MLKNKLLKNINSTRMDWKQKDAQKHGLIWSDLLKYMPNLWCDMVYSINHAQ